MPSEAHKLLSSESLKRGHEVSEKRIRNVLIVAGGAIFALIAGLLICGFAMHLLAAARPMQSMTPLGIISAPNLKPLERFPAPNLQIDDDHAERVALYATQTATLSSYGWISRDRGIVHIPINRAMELIVQRGLLAQTNDVSHGISPLQLMQAEGGKQ
jgi:hypothetical protein